MLLRRALWRAGLRYRVNRPGLPGRPDLVFAKARVVIFCDGDFWHGRDLEARLARLAAGHNAPYWVAKIRRNVERDRETNAALAALGWKVLRFWETEILREMDAVVRRVNAELNMETTEGPRGGAATKMG
jgi:DNA mismatch endonuclease (patch repair protein)